MDPNTYNYYTSLYYNNTLGRDSMNNIYTTYNTVQDNNIEKPWQRASKNPNLVVKGTELFVGNLSTETSEIDLYEVFKDCGEVIDVIIGLNFR
jgi:RNA recognition motif-containing protein